VTPATFAAGYVVPLALAATAADATVRYMPGPLPGELPDDGDRWIFSGIGTYRMIKRRAAAMRAAMPPEESAALLVEGAALEAAGRAFIAAIEAGLIAEGVR
jgi:hypothetical protein